MPARKALSGGAKSNYESGLKSARSGNAAAAKTSFEAAVKADPNAFQALYGLGVLSDVGAGSVADTIRPTLLELSQSPSLPPRGACSSAPAGS